MASRKRLKTSRRSYEECNYNESQERGYNFNQGSPEELQKSDYNYFLSVFECAENSFEDEEELDIYLRNVYESVRGYERKIVVNTRLSYLFEKLLNLSSIEYLVIFFEKVLDGDLLAHYNASHIFQTFLEVSLKRMGSMESLEIDEMATKLIDLILWFVRSLSSNLAASINDVYASHVLSTLLQTLAGCQVSSRALQKKKSKKAVVPCQCPDIPESKLPKSLKSGLNSLLEQLLSVEGLRDLLSQTHSSQVYQTALLIMSKRNSPYLQQYIESVIDCLFDNANVMDVVSDPCLAPLIETVLSTSPESVLKKLCDTHFKGTLADMALHPTANFVAQQLLRRCPTRTEAESMFNELEKSWDDIANMGHNCVFTALADLCARLKSSQRKFIEKLTELLCCSNGNDCKLLVPLVLTWTPKDQFGTMSRQSGEGDNYWPNHITYSGSVLLQTLLKFQKPFLVVSSIFATDAKELAAVFCGPCGSHVLDAFASSTQVGAKNRHRLVEKLKGHFIELACSKFGSRCLETLWKSLDVNDKVVIAQELLESKSKLRSNKFGTFFFITFDLDKFKHRQAEWRQQHQKKSRKTAVT